MVFSRQSTGGGTMCLSGTRWSSGGVSGSAWGGGGGALRRVSNGKGMASWAGPECWAE